MADFWITDEEAEDRSLILPKGRKKLPKGFKDILFLTYREAKEIVRAWSQNQKEIYLNLDLSYTDRKFKVTITREEIIFPQLGVKVPYKRIKKIAKNEDEGLYIITTEGMEKVIFSDNGKV